LIIYSIILGLKNRKIFGEFADHLKSEGKRFAFLITLFFALSWISALYFHMILSTPLTFLTSVFLFPFLLTFVLLFAHYAKLVEDKLFKKKVNVNDLKVGDVISEGRWKGLTKSEIEKIKKVGRYVWIKEGVRFAPVFLFTQLITIFYGDLAFIFL
jgi:prepilin signal peptidase PulO-like enzyme (type II secretory pathway)